MISPIFRKKYTQANVIRQQGRKSNNSKSNGKNFLHGQFYQFEKKKYLKSTKFSFTLGFELNNPINKNHEVSTAVPED